MMFLLGMLAFIAWAWTMGLQANSIGMLKVSAVYFGLGSLLAAFPIVALDFATTGLGKPVVSAWTLLLAFVVAEELLKFLAARTQTTPKNAFAIVTLFGVYELMLSKPLTMLLQGNWYLGLEIDTLFALPALALHGLTAGVYAFNSRHQPLRQLAVCILLHAAFNSLAEGLIFPMASDWWILLLTIPMLALTGLLWKGQTPQAKDLGGQAG